MRKKYSKKSRFKILRRRSVYQGRAVNLSVDRLRLPNGQVIEREILHHTGSAVIIPMLDSRSLILIRQFRYSVGGYIWEFPAGTNSSRESPLQCAKRELEEETGFTAKKFRKLLTFYPTPGVSTEIMHLYLATELTRTQSKLEEDEILHAKIFRIPEIDRMIKSGKITDGKTILGFLQFMKLRGR